VVSVKIPSGNGSKESETEDSAMDTRFSELSQMKSLWSVTKGVKIHECFQKNHKLQ